MKEQARYIVNIQCQQCGEKFTLKGRVKKGKIETGFKRCLCDNEESFEVFQKEL